MELCDVDFYFCLIIYFKPQASSIEVYWFSLGNCPKISYDCLIAASLIMLQ